MELKTGMGDVGRGKTDYKLNSRAPRPLPLVLTPSPPVSCPLPPIMSFKQAGFFSVAY